MKSRWLAGELVVLAACIVTTWWLSSVATTAWLGRVDRLGVPHPEVDAVRSAARMAALYMSIGIAILGASRFVGVRRSTEPIGVPWLLPALVVACLFGLAVQLATVEVTRGVAELPTGAGFAQGFVVGSVGAAVVLVAPIDIGQLASRAWLPIAIAIGALFAALAVAGTGPAGSGTRINLGPIQPIEVIKLLAVVFLAAYIAPRAPKLRWQRQRFLGLRWPRPVLLIPALAVLVGIVIGLRVIGDLGPVLLLAVVFLGMFYVASRATGWVVIAIAMVALAILLLAVWPGLAGSGTVKTRLVMWRDPWTNGLSNGQQLGEGLWAFAAGGFSGQGLGHATTPLVPAGKTDLVLATLTEQLGVRGAVAYQLALAAIAIGALRVATLARTAERVLLAAGVAIMVIAQWLVILAGTLGYLPLTGIVVPFVSSGRSSMAVFVVAIALVARLGADGGARARSAELDELHAASRDIRRFAIAGVAFALLVTIAAGAIGRTATSSRTILARLADGTLVEQANPRLVAIARKLHRGPIVDRSGAALAEATGERRRYPLARDLGTLLGIAPSRVLLPAWAIERQFDDRLRGYRDFAELAPLLELDEPDRDAAIAKRDADVAPRTVKLALDARLQSKVAALARDAVAKRHHLAAAAVVIDVDSGQILARAQVPDYDPNAPDWEQRVLAGDAAFVAKFHGAYGEWPDKTGVHGMFQAGSVGKLVTAIAAVRSGAADARFECRDRDTQGPAFSLPAWTKPIHDHTNDPTHGTLGLPTALAVSCNVYFAQLGLQLGPGPLAKLRADGLAVGFGDAFVPGAAGTRQLASTAFGQGAMVINAVQAARLAAVVANGGRYLECASLELAAPCTTATLVDDPARLRPVLDGMRRVMTAGTGSLLSKIDGVRVYGKTGTADVRGFAGEQSFGIAPAQVAAPHSWFVAIAEPATTTELAPRAPKRLAVAVVIPRGGTGASAAGPLAIQIITAARDLGYLR